MVLTVTLVAGLATGEGEGCACAMYAMDAMLIAVDRFPQAP